MSAIVFVVKALLQYLLVTAFLLRVLLPISRANMRNPLSQAVLRVTNPLVLPLRKFLPPIGRVDSASIVALLLVQLVTILIVSILEGRIGSPPVVAVQVVYTLLDSLLQLYSFAIFIYVLLGWVAPSTYSPANDLLGSLCEPLMRPVRRLIPPVAGLDLTPVFVLILLQAVQQFLLPDLYLRLLRGMV